jgi:hypothetical protein
VIDAAKLRHVQREVGRRSGGRRRTWLAMLVTGAAAAAWVATAPDGSAASTRWLWTAVALYAVAMLRVPFVLFWRADAALLARLPIEGRPLWGAAQWATGELAAQALAASSLAALPLAVLAGPDAVAVLGRHAALAVALAFAAAALVPAVAVAAGALVVSGKADQLLAGLGGEVKAPPTAWLGVLPGLASAVAVLLAIDVGGWLRGGHAEVGDAVLLLAGMSAASVVAALLARAAADRVMPAMLRDVSALDRQQLATIELTAAPATLRALGRQLTPGARLLLDKHARLLARRHPMSAVLGAVAFAILAISALASSHAAVLQVTTLAVTFAYAMVLRGRMAQPPVELPRLRDSLPLTPGDAQAAARTYVLWWWGWFALLPGALVLARTAQLWQVAPALAAGTLLLVLGGGGGRATAR